MLEHNLFVVSGKGKLLSSNRSFEIRDSGGKLVGTAEQTTGLLAKLIGMVKGPPSTQIEFKRASDNSPVFTVRRRGLLFKKVEVVAPNGTVIGRYKGKRFSLAGGFHIYDQDGKHVAEIRGKLMKSEYTIFAPDGKTQMGKVSKKWDGLVKELFTSKESYGVEISPEFASDEKAKIRILGAAVAMDALFGGGGGGGGDDGGGDDD